MASVALTWGWIYVEPGDTWVKNIRPQLVKEGFRDEELNRAVYVVRLKGNFLMRYPWGKSPVVYIGEGDSKARLGSHNKLSSWMGKLAELVDGYSFEIGVVCPRVKKSPETYRDLEAYMLYQFSVIYGCIPLRNRQFETRLCKHTYSQKTINHALKTGQGMRYSWAVEPLPNMGKIYDSYHLGWNPKALA
jgi:hypothetical protein